MRWTPRIDGRFRKLLRPAFRLRTLMVLVVVVSAGLGIEADCRRRGELRRLALIAENRAKLVGEHEAHARDLREEVRRVRKDIDDRRRVEARLKPGPLTSSGNYDDRGETYFEFLARKLLYLEKRAEWELEMASIVRWAADHPARPWPPQPPEPIEPTMAGNPAPLPLPPLPIPELPPEVPIDVPTVVKKNR